MEGRERERDRTVERGRRIKGEREEGARQKRFEIESKLFGWVHGLSNKKKIFKMGQSFWDLKINSHISSHFFGTGWDETVTFGFQF